MKKINLILSLMLIITLSGCQLAKQNSSDNINPIPTDEIKDRQIGIIVYTATDIDYQMPNYLEALCEDENGNLSCTFDKDIGNGYLSIFSYNSIEDNKLPVISGNQDSPLQLLDNQIYFEEETIDEITVKKNRQDVSYKLLLSANKDTTYMIRMLTIYYNENEEKVYAQKDAADLAIKNETPVHQTAGMTIEQKNTDINNNDHSCSIELSVTTTDIPVSSVVKEFDQNNRLIKTTAIDITADEYTPSDHCFYIITETTKLDYEGQDFIDIELYDHDDENITIPYQFDDNVIGQKSILIIW